jgi:hypothetical protein
MYERDKAVSVNLTDPITFDFESTCITSFTIACPRGKVCLSIQLFDSHFGCGMCGSADWIRAGFDINEVEYYFDDDMNLRCADGSILHQARDHQRHLEKYGHLKDGPELEGL